MLLKSIAHSQRLKSFDDSLAYHLHKSICNDLNLLLKDSFCGSPRSVTTSESCSPCASTDSPITLPIGNSKVVQIQFKHLTRNYKLPLLVSDVEIGEFIVVQSFVDKSTEDLGIVTRVFTAQEFDDYNEALGPSDDIEETKMGKILRVATKEERAYLPNKFESEHIILLACQDFVSTRLLPMRVYGVEYQFDGNVLFVYYLSKDRVDYRPLVKYLLKSYCKGVRISMKKMNQSREFVPVPSATYALSTGKHANAIWA